MLCSGKIYAHSGGTDSQGGHWNHSTGEYHFHHGHGEHQHPNGICPYDSAYDGTYAPGDMPQEKSYAAASASNATTYSNSDDDADEESNYDNTNIVWYGIGAFIIYEVFLKKPKSTNTSASTITTDIEVRSSKNDASGFSSYSSYSIYCPKCGARMVKRNGRYGPFYGCSNYPRCRGTRSIYY